ncbi:LacI family DNA-binding transcriptional regulator [Mycobacterium sherrisii]|uniref:LacI family DNA-binding transcriptional regulator n=1 Tax=Mycobacterium sherrisii TaxID=243061 RepID=UPI001301FDFB|nr:LacI family DNA-binding transcriptional regulator [Mycobacterium sherrisii]MCV7032396.1 LacI family DNA-binding transcriptional regulator [Mycobacterium sherrisii]MEC4763521.1 LacI family DNA-binding transcriptional regulator [Mycobacterium sherrisii]
MTIKDVARAANVSVTTVSDALSGNGRLTAKTRSRVRAVADKLGYRPSAAARSLVGARTGLLVLSVGAPAAEAASLWSIDFFVNLMTAAAIRSSTHGFALALSPESLSPNLSYDGAIIVDPTADDESLLVRATRAGVPVVTVGRTMADHPWVDNDYPTVIPAVLDHLRSSGARRPALLAGDPTASYVRDAVEHYTRWCRVHRCASRISYVDGGSTEESGRAAAKRLLSGRGRSDAVLATLDRLALGVTAAAGELGLSIPDDVLVAALGDSTMIQHLPVPITAVDLMPAEMGAVAIDSLVARINGGDVALQTIVPGRVLPRASSQR